MKRLHLRPPKCAAVTRDEATSRMEMTSRLSRSSRNERKRNSVDTTSFSLRTLVHCAHYGCRMTPGNHHGRTARVRYYECTSATKRGGTACPVRRVNAHSVHAAVLKEIQRAAQPTRMAELIREAVKKLPETQKTNDMLQALNRRIREVDKKMGNCLAAIEASGRAAVSLVKRLETLEAERVSMQTERQQVEYQIAESRLARPNVERSM